MYVSRQECPLHLPVGVGPFLDPRAVEDACVKVGQTFLSALLVFTQHFVRLPLSSRERGPGGEVLLPKGTQKKDSCRLYSVGATGRSPLHVVTHSGFCGIFPLGVSTRRVVACQDTGFRGPGLMYVSRQECLLHPFKLLFKVSLGRMNHLRQTDRQYWLPLSEK